MPSTPGDVADLQAILHGQTMSMVGLMLGTLLTGILLTLGASSIFLLSSNKDKGLLGQNCFLCIYIIILLLTVLVFDVGVFILGNGFSIFLSQLPNKILELFEMWSVIVGSTALTTTLLANGIFVWRCFLVQRALGPYKESKWGNVLWVFPACLWILSLGTGITTFVSTRAQNIADPLHSNIFGAITIAYNSALNIYATTFIIARLLTHRRLVIACLRDSSPAFRHLHIVTILLESAAINIPISITTAVGLATGQTFGEVNAFIVVPNQALASVIIIHQVALGRAFSWQRGDELRIEVAPRPSHAAGVYTLSQ